jgi:hypothetical protein
MLDKVCHNMTHEIFPQNNIYVFKKGQESEPEWRLIKFYKEQKDPSPTVNLR